MDRLHAPSREERSLPKQEVEYRCILCDAIIELAEHEVFFATGRCRYCHEAMEEDERSAPPRA